MRNTLALACMLLFATTALAQGLPPAGVRTGTVARESVRDHVTGVATVEPWRRSTLSAEHAGLVENYPLREGDRVTAGETVVCQLKQTSLLIDLEEAKALLARAEAEVATSVETARATVEERRALRDRTERDLERSRELFKDQVITKSEFDQDEAEAIAARYQFERAEQDLELAEAGADTASMARQADVRRAKAHLDRIDDQIAKTRIVSPVTGNVVRRLTEVGEWVSPGSPVIEIVTLDPALVRVGVNERDIAKVRVGDPATVTVDAYPGRPFTGKIRFIVPEADRTTRSFPVLIEVKNPDLALKSGMFARISIEAGEGRSVLTVPKDAVVTGPRGSMVFTSAPGKSPDGKDILVARPIPVVPGVSVDGRMVITGEGIEAGLTVITTGNEKLMPGMQVIPMGSEGEGGKGPERER